MTSYYIGVEEEGLPLRPRAEVKEAIEAGEGPFHVWSSGKSGQSPWDTTAGRQNVSESEKDRPPAACGTSGFPSRVVFVSTTFGGIVPGLLRAPNLCEDCREAVVEYFNIPESEW